mmetsp:Transcript_10302/g.15489  ORF Transcript_10302/g.15489 Transcript_10302/m.15489 type:complete len:509 (-) Transcript_10302:757-2283(-)
MDLDTPTSAASSQAAPAYQQVETTNTSAPWAQNQNAALQQYYAQFYTDPTQYSQAQSQAYAFTPGTNGQPTYAQYASMGQTAYLTTEQYQKPQPPVQHQYQYPYQSTTSQTPTTTASDNKLRFKIQAPKRNSSTTPKAFQTQSNPPPPPPAKSQQPPPPPSPSAEQPPPTPSPSKKKKKEENEFWPPALRKYVERAFESCKTQEERIGTETYLKQKIQDTMHAETVWSYDWENEPLPLEGQHFGPKSGEKRKRNQALKKKGKREETSEKPKKKKEYLHHYSVETEEERKKISERENRFRSCTRKPSFMGSLESNTIIKGTCTNLEKKYLRLTTAADPSLIRPERILKESVEMIKRKWKAREVDYQYVCEQFKSIRQDLTVQHIKNPFTVKVYEMHARLAIENGDIGEYNQCQTQLTPLYASGIQGNRAEFTAYAILYFSLKNNYEALGSFLKKIPDDLRRDTSVKYALETHRAYTTRNFYRFFKLLKTTPHLNSYIINMFIDKVSDCE